MAGRRLIGGRWIRRPGTPTGAGLALDVRAAHRYLVTDAGVPSATRSPIGSELLCAVVEQADIG
ncbi:hypothetical protein ACFQE5_15990 [Pseudonocardia hispaniensis]|uniref:Uncharacterized protein n=1 Tax=Pseudonocardia hispaniensis TaxID=904933 RepID=A0ABW1J4H1_9PSEU